MTDRHVREPLSQADGEKLTLVDVTESVASAARANRHLENIERFREPSEFDLAQMKINSRNKGKVGERELAHFLSTMLNIQCRRGQQYSGIEGEDVVGVPGLHIECKRVERLNVHAALKQSTLDAKVDEVPVVCHRSSRKPWLITLALADLNRLCEVLCKLKENPNESD